MSLPFPGSLPFTVLAETSARVASRAARLKKIDALAETLEATPPTELADAVSLLAGILPTGKIGVGWKTVHAALEEAKGTERPETSDAPSYSPDLQTVLETLRAIGSESGKGSAARRHTLLVGLFGSLNQQARTFLANVLVGELRQGALEGVVLDAVSRMRGIDLKSLRRAAMLAGSITEVAQTVLTEGESALERYQLTVFQPVQPMLAQPAADLDEAIAELTQQASDEAAESAALFEYKIDGARVQVHREANTVRVYSRRLLEVTEAVPEVVEAALALPCERAILDGETFAVKPHPEDPSRLLPVPFQETMRRFGRRLDVAKMRKTLPLQVRFFDCLLCDQTELIDEPLTERRSVLERLVPSSQLMPAKWTLDPSEAKALFENSIAEGHEGLMAKAGQSPYAAGSRGKSWLKIKPVHTLDLVVLAVEWGSGRRRGKLSNLHLGARDVNGTYSEGAPPWPKGWVMLGKTFKGLTDELLEWQTKELLARETHREQHVVYVRPELVVEIAFNNVQRSPQYPAGVALRFARVKGYRNDKSADQADTIEQVLSLAP